MSKAGIRVADILIWFFALLILLFLRISFSFERSLANIVYYLIVDTVCIWLAILPIVNNNIARIFHRWPRWKILWMFLYDILICLFHQFVIWLWLSSRLSSTLSAKEYNAVNVTYHSFLYQVFDTYMIIGLAVLGAYAYVFYRNFIQERINRQVLEQENIKAELTYLKSQINPHFLFNSINLIFGYIDKSNQEARDTLLKFSEILRYQLYETNVVGIRIEKEVNYIRNYIALQRMRKSDKLKVVFEVDDNVRDFEIPPLLLIFFIENAFKHISSHESIPNYITIRLSFENDTFFFICENSVDLVKDKPSYSDSGIGIRNVSRRLELMYPGFHELIITELPDRYRAHLSLKLNSRRANPINA